MTIEFDELAQSDNGSDDRRGRRRIIGGVAAAMLIASAGGVGYGIGGGVDRDIAAIDAGGGDASRCDTRPAPTPTTERGSTTFA